MSQPLSPLHCRFPVGTVVSISLRHGPEIGVVFATPVKNDMPEIQLVFQDGKTQSFDVHDLGSFRIHELGRSPDAQQYQLTDLDALKSDVERGVFSFAFSTSLNNRVVYRHPRHMNHQPFMDHAFYRNAQAALVDSPEKAQTLIHALAIKSKPEFGGYFEQGQFFGNTQLRALGMDGVPEAIRDQVIQLVEKMNDEEVEAIVTDGLNSVYERLGDYSRCPNLAEKVAWLARDYMQTCLNESESDLEFNNQHASGTISSGPKF